MQMIENSENQAAKDRFKENTHLIKVAQRLFRQRKTSTAHIVNESPRKQEIFNGLMSRL